MSFVTFITAGDDVQQTLVSPLRSAWKCEEGSWSQSGHQAEAEVVRWELCDLHPDGVFRSSSVEHYFLPGFPTGSSVDTCKPTARWDSCDRLQTRLFNECSPGGLKQRSIYFSLLTCWWRGSRCVSMNVFVSSCFISAVSFIVTDSVNLTLNLQLHFINFALKGDFWIHKVIILMYISGVLERDLQTGQK